MVSPGTLPTHPSDDWSPLLVGANSVSCLLGTVVEAVAALPAADAVSVSLRDDGGGLETVGSSSPVARLIDEVQYASELGPCVEAIRTGAEVRAGVPAAGWPDFSAAAAEASLCTVWSLPLTVEEQVSGSLNVYSTAGGVWDGPSAGPIRSLARQAAAVLTNGLALAQREHMNLTLRRALETRTVIGQAQGVLMARQGIDADDAFDILRRASQRTNRKLREVAAEIVAGAVVTKPRS